VPSNRPNPIGIQVLEDLSPKLGGQIKNLSERVKDADNANADWLKKQLGYIKRRFGKKRKRRTPWAGASNINMPLVDGIVRRWRPGITALILDANPVAHFVAQETKDLDPARTVEPFFMWLFIDHMDTPPEVAKLADLIAYRGHSYVREGWDYETSTDSRVVNAADLFPGGAQQWAQQQIQAQQGQEGSPEDLQPETVIAQKLIEEYELNPQSQPVMAEAIRAASKILQGAPFVRITYERVIKDRPAWKALDPINTIVEQEGDPEKAPFFCVIHRLTNDQILRKAKDGTFTPELATAVVRKMGENKSGSESSANRSGGAGGSNLRQQIRDFLDRRGGVRRVDSNRVKTPRTDVWELFCRLDLNGDGLEERCILWYAPEFDLPLAFTHYPFNFDTWPITCFMLEPQADRPVDSRGMPEMLNDLAKLVDHYHNSRVDASQITLSPVFAQRQTSLGFENNMQWRPGAIFQVAEHGDIAPIQHDLRILQALFGEEQSNQRAAENYVGTFDATLNQLSRPTERRTAAEVHAISQLSTDVFGLDARLFQINMGRSFKKIWSLWQEWGAEKTFFRVQGEPQPRVAKKSELGYDYDIHPAGTPSSTNKQFLMANMREILQIVIQDQTGRFDVGALLKAYFDLIDPKIAKIVVRSPEQTQAAQTVMQAAQQQGLDAGQAVV
jgi:hypothetical protein